MNSGSSLSLVIPAFNEALRIERTLDAVRAALPALVSRWEIRVVDDGSVDDTAAKVARVAIADARVVLQREPHRGKGAAVRAGMLATRADLRFMCDADLSMPLTQLPRFLEAVPARADIAIGSREGSGARRVNEPAYRHYLGRVFNALTQGGALRGIEDTQCGFKMFSSRAADTVFARVTVEGWAFDVEALTIAIRHGLRIAQVPIEWHYGELSRVSVAADAFRMMRDVRRIRRNAARGAYDSTPLS